MDANDLRQEIVRISHLFYQRGWSMATSSNFSARFDLQSLLITASGRDKGLLREEDILLVDLEGNVQQETELNPSAETTLHCELYRFQQEIGAILHTHSVYSTMISSLPDLKAPLSIGGYEMVKALRGVSTHHHTEQLPVFANDQDMKRLSNGVVKYLQVDPAVHGFLIAGHGLYSWGRTLSEALRHVEAFEFVLECEYRRRSGK